MEEYRKFTEKKKLKLKKKVVPVPNITKMNPKRLVGEKNTEEKFEENRTKRFKARERTKIEKNSILRNVCLTYDSVHIVGDCFAR